MPSKWSGSEGTDVARKFTDIRISEGLYMNSFHGETLDEKGRSCVLVFITVASVSASRAL